MSRDSLNRRALLGTLATGVAASLAGCGYQPAAGEYKWSESVSVGPSVPFSDGESTWLAGTDRLYSVANVSGRTPQPGEDGWRELDEAYVSAFDSSGEELWTTDAAEQYVGDPVFADGTIYLALEGGSVTAVGPGSDDEGEVHWTTEVDTDDGRDERDEESDDERGEAGDDVDGEGSDDDDSGDDEDGTDDSEEELELAAGSPLVVALGDGELWGFEAATGEELFEAEVPASQNATAIAAAGEYAWVAFLEDDEHHLAVFDTGGERETRSLPEGPEWLVAGDDLALLGFEDESAVWGVVPDGNRQFELEFELDPGPRSPIIVDHTAYLESGGDLLAIDLEAGERLWDLDSPLSGGLVADADSIYGWASGSGCGLASVDSSGEFQWDATLPDEITCRDDLFVLEDTLVVAGSNGDLTGFRTESGRRYSVVS
ncbi:PQQ-like domain-containing protein [Natronorubrum sediminis]|uniref:PQQ-like domain-containing protein n=1 Tax=Natronorubrum sediminis TaxID=640943 RepID=A0A1H6FQP4_9EURY|nr:PQQ-binding-like beta-propeller repeat protein [Natronorubrum sediminis]SEH13216.1 PQQ-like domain-containing protein [Natronorubrum sediminis]